MGAYVLIVLFHNMPQVNTTQYTPYHSHYWAQALTLNGPVGSIDALSRSIANARVDLNPHQIDAALFALRSPLSRGVILADEVGLGKTIEAGLVIAQRWAERRRRILLVVPATLRQQWQQELEEKFYLPTLILDAASFATEYSAGRNNPFERADRVVICSYHFAAAKSDLIQQVPWDCVVVDEAHRLRNVYKSSSKLARAVAKAIAPAPKLLLTATPLQNSLMELYGLVSVIDDWVFGDAASFREQFVRAPDERIRNLTLRERLKPICKRTLRKHVTEYIPFTRRVPITQDFHPSDAEQELYDLVSRYLQRDDLIALPPSQRALMTLVLRKVLASSTFAIAGTLRGMIARLEQLGTHETAPEAFAIGGFDLDELDELADELAWDADDGTQSSSLVPVATATREAIEQRLRAELAELRHFIMLAESITRNAKGDALITALESAFMQAGELGAQRKAVIFTESRRTQHYLFDLLSTHGYAGQLVLINGTNGDPLSTTIYQQWTQRHAGTELAAASRPVGVKAAIIEHFRDHATILIATEAAAEGVNLQFCSLVVNYDLPWNPQRIEQRIGRCHRYGQKHDVVVVNFLNRRNEADQRVFQLLSEKFRLFDGVFGSSDEVLGAIETGVDIERRIAQVYQTCRTGAEITAAFDALQAELDVTIQARLAETRQALLEHFDEDVGARLRLRQSSTRESLSQRERWLFDLTRTALTGVASFDAKEPRFSYRGTLAPHGTYHLDWRAAEREDAIFYRQEHPLAAQLLQQALDYPLPLATLQFDYAAYGAQVSVLKPLRGTSGWLELSKLSVTAFEREEYLVFAAMADDGTPLDDEVCRKLLQLPARVGLAPVAGRVPALDELREQGIAAQLAEVDERNAHFFDEEVLKLDRWSDDLKQGLEREISEIDRAIREARREAGLAAALQQKLDAQRTVRELETFRNGKRRELYEAQDQIDSRRDGLIREVEARLQRQQHAETLFTLRWTLR